MADTIMLDGFRYEWERGNLWDSEKGEAKPVIVLRLISADEDIRVEAYFPEEAIAAFLLDAPNGGVSPDYLRRLGL